MCGSGKKAEPIRYCKYCGKPLPKYPGVRRKYHPECKKRAEIWRNRIRDNYPSRSFIRHENIYYRAFKDIKATLKNKGRLYDALGIPVWDTLAEMVEMAKSYDPRREVANGMRLRRLAKLMDAVMDCRADSKKGKVPKKIREGISDYVSMDLQHWKAVPDEVP